MGDMKTPDFDDLLAAFDIPDIDAKEAIQSSPDDEQNDIRSATNERMSGAPSCFPCPPATHSDPPVVSVIVKNTVRTESFDEERCLRDTRVSPPNCGLNAHVQVKFDHLTSHPGPKVPIILPVEPQISNGFEESIGEQGQSSTHTWPIHSAAGPSSRTSKSEADKEDDIESVQQAADVISSLKPLLYPQTSSSPSLKSSVALFPSHESQQEEACLSLNPSTSLSQNGTMKDVIKHTLHSDEENSEPDLGSPLVIHESPVSIMSSPPKFKGRAKALLGSPETISCLVSPPDNFPLLMPAKPAMQGGDKNENATSDSHSIAPLLQSPRSSSDPNTDSAEKKEEYPEHVIEERDSPESPPPSEMGILVPKRSSSPDLSQTVNHKDSGHKQEVMESEPREENRQSEYEHLSESIALKETFGADTEGAHSPPLHPLKVKIKMQSGSITKTVSASNPKRSGKNSAKSGDGLKNPPENNTKSKAELQATSTTERQEETSTVKEASNETVDKPLVTPTAVNVTRTAALPSISASLPRVSPSSLGLRNLSSAPHLLHPQNNNKPASIVNSTGAIISKSQTSLVEAFNKILNNRNPLPSYKPDLSTLPPAEWGLPLPAQVNSSSFIFLPFLINQYKLAIMYVFNILFSCYFIV